MQKSAVDTEFIGAEPIPSADARSSPKHPRVSKAFSSRLLTRGQLAREICSRTIVLAVATLISLPLCITATSAKGIEYPTTIALPNGWRPEGITAGRKNDLYIGSLANGAIWKADAKSGNGTILSSGAPGMVSVGLDYDKRNERLWVAGGTTKEVRAVDADTGAIMGRYPIPATGFLNDVVVTREAVYVTNSSQALLVVIPTPRDGSLPPMDAATSIPLTGDWVQAPGFNANGIVSVGKFLIIVQSNTGKLFRVDPTTGDSKLIDLGGYSVRNGDGLELNGETLYVTRNQNRLVAKVELRSNWLSGVLVDELIGALDVPTTSALQAGRLWVVNARFGIPVPDTSSFSITQLNP